MNYLVTDTTKAPFNSVFNYNGVPINLIKYDGVLLGISAAHTFFGRGYDTSIRKVVLSNGRVIKPIKTFCHYNYNKPAMDKYGLADARYDIMCAVFDENPAEFATIEIPSRISTPKGMLLTGILQDKLHYGYADSVSDNWGKNIIIDDFTPIPGFSGGGIYAPDNNNNWHLIGITVSTISDSLTSAKKTIAINLTEYTYWLSSCIAEAKRHPRLLLQSKSLECHAGQFKEHNILVTPLESGLHHISVTPTVESLDTAAFYRVRANFADGSAALAVNAPSLYIGAATAHQPFTLSLDLYGKGRVKFSELYIKKGV